MPFTPLGPQVFLSLTGHLKAKLKPLGILATSITLWHGTEEAVLEETKSVVDSLRVEEAFVPSKYGAPMVLQMHHGQ